MSQELYLFIKEGLAHGLTREQLREALRTAKWSSEDIDSALHRFAVSDFPIPVPAPKSSLSAREAFVYLVLFVTLYLTAFSIGSLWFSFIDRWFPDALFTNYYSSDASGIRQACATLLITAPLFFGLSFRVRQRLAQHPDERQSGVRKWLTYLTLFVAASIIIGTLIGLVMNVLSGELTWRFFLKATTVLVITGVGFGYYLWDLRQDEVPLTRSVQTRVRIFVSLLLLLTTGTLASGLYLSGSPAHERTRRLDEQRTQTLDRLTYAIDNYTTLQNHLPTTTADIWQERTFSDTELPILVQRLPDFSYQIQTSSTYQLCTSFALPSEDTITGQTVPVVPKPVGVANWSHHAGLNCFALDVRRQPR